MDQRAMEQVQAALHYISTDLDRVQSALTTYESQMLSGERTSPQLKEVVTYYRGQTTELRKEVLSLCNLMTAYYKHELLAAGRKEAVDVPAPLPPLPPLPQMSVVLPGEPLFTEEPAQQEPSEPAQEMPVEGIPEAVPF